MTDKSTSIPDVAKLRQILRPMIVEPALCGHKDIANKCKELAMPDPPPMSGYSKRERLETSFDAVNEHHLAEVAERFLRLYSPSPEIRNQIQDTLWEHSALEIPRKFRREIAEKIALHTLYGDSRAFDRLLHDLWIMDSYVSDLAKSLREVVRKHVHENHSDLTPTQVFEYLGAFECPSARFTRFIEGLVSADVQPDESVQRALVASINLPLRKISLELREAGQSEGYTVFKVFKAASAIGRVKQIIFGYPVKPDLRLRDAVSNDIEIVGNAEYYLVYDKPIDDDRGLSWADLRAWWFERRGGDGKEERNALLKRLVDSLPVNSPPQRLLFDTYLRTVCKGRSDLPALLPEVWLHWDHKTYEERGLDGLSRQRMDFLMLLPGRTRVVIEVDGVQHYSDKVGGSEIASPTKYARMVAADRETRLLGYEVFRFGGAELHVQRASDKKRTQEVQTLVEEFFIRFFAKHRLGKI